MRSLRLFCCPIWSMPIYGRSVTPIHSVPSPSVVATSTLKNPITVRMACQAVTLYHQSWGRLRNFWLSMASSIQSNYWLRQGGCFGTSSLSRNITLQASKGERGRLNNHNSKGKRWLEWGRWNYRPHHPAANAHGATVGNSCKQRQTKKFPHTPRKISTPCTNLLWRRHTAFSSIPQYRYGCETQTWSTRQPELQVIPTLTSWVRRMGQICSQKQGTWAH